MRSRSDGSRTVRPRDRGAYLVFSALLVAALVAPAGLLLASWRLDEAEPPPLVARPVFSPGQTARSVTVTATATATWEPGLGVPAPAWTGLVTAVHVRPGDTLREGDAIVDVDGIEIRYYRFRTPLYRSVCPGDVELVDDVRHVLKAAGLGVAGTTTLSGVDVAGIRDFASAIGVPDAKKVSCFEPSWVVSTSAPLGPVDTVQLAVGVPAPPQGEPILIGRATLESLVVSGNTGAREIDDLLTGDGASSFAGTELIIGAVRTGVPLASLDDDDALADLAEHLDPESASESIAVELRLGDGQLLVPPTAVIDPTGPSPCLESESSTTVPVSVVASSISGIVVTLSTHKGFDSYRSAPERLTCT